MSSSQNATSPDVFEVDYQNLERLAQGHDQHAQEVAHWAGLEPDFAERLLETHGKVAYGTYLNVKAYNESRQRQATIYAERNDATAASLRKSIESTQATDEAAAAQYRPATTSSPGGTNV